MVTVTSMNITVLLVRYPQDRPTPVVAEMLRRLRAAAEVSVIHPDEIDVDQVRLPPTDLVVIKAKSPAALTLAHRYHQAGIPTITHYPQTVLCRDKIATTAALAESGIPVPETTVVQDAMDLAPLLEHGPLIVKPYRGSQGRGIQVVRGASELADVDHGGDPIMAQAYFAPDGPDRKIYRIGEELFCVERTWPPRTIEEKMGRLVDLDPELHQIAWNCGSALGIDLYGVDIITHDGRPWVVDLSSFPGFKGVPDAGRRLADHIIARTVSTGTSTEGGPCAAGPADRGTPTSGAHDAGLSDAGLSDAGPFNVGTPHPQTPNPVRQG